MLEDEGGCGVRQRMDLKKASWGYRQILGWRCPPACVMRDWQFVMAQVVTLARYLHPRLQLPSLSMFSEQARRGIR